MQANWPMIGLLAFMTGIAVYVSRVMFKRWFNPLSIYSVMWGFCLCNYELQLIQLYPINATAWIYIVVAWVSLYFGAATMLLLSPPGRRVVGPAVVVDLGLLKKMIIWSSVIVALGLV